MNIDYEIFLKGGVHYSGDTYLRVQPIGMGKAFIAFNHNDLESFIPHDFAFPRVERGEINLTDCLFDERKNRNGNTRAFVEIYGTGCGTEYVFQSVAFQEDLLRKSLDFYLGRISPNGGKGVLEIIDLAQKVLGKMPLTEIYPVGKLIKFRAKDESEKIKILRENFPKIPRVQNTDEKINAIMHATDYFENGGEYSYLGVLRGHF